MKRYYLGCHLLGCHLVVLTLMLSAGAAVAKDILITNANIQSMDQDSVIEGWIRIRDGLITRIDSGTGAPATETDLEVVDVGGKTVTPGLFDSGSTIGLVEVNLGTKAEDQTYKGDSMTAGFEVSLAFNQYSSLIPIVRNEGVTHALIRPSPGINPIAGQGAVVQLGGGDDSGHAGDSGGDSRNDPVISSTAPVFVYLGEKGRDLAGESRAAALQGLLDALEEARLYSDNKTAYRFRLLQELTLSTADLKVFAAVLEKRKSLAIYVDRAADIMTVLESLDSYQLKIVLVGAREAWKVTHAISSRNIPVVLNVLDNVPSSFDQLGARLDQAALLQQAGIKFAFMTEDLFTETRMLSQAAGVAVAYGLPWLAAMKAITLNPAQIWGVDDKTGSITSGKQANLVVWSGDPLELDSFPERIMMNGKWIDMQTRQQLLRDRYREIYRKDTPFGYR